MKIQKIFSLLVFAAGLSVTAAAQDKSCCGKCGDVPTVTVFGTPYEGIPVRIPAMAVTKDKNVLALVDYRYNWSDIGWKAHDTYRLDILLRRSGDNGRTWGPVITVAQGNDNYGYGDPSVVADRDSAGLILVHAVGGNVPYWKANAENPQHAIFFRSTDGGLTWDEGHDMAAQIYALYKEEQPLTQEKGLFLTSGKITQSRIIKKDKYYRLYIAHPILNVGAFVLYSDDFGRSWHVLGGAGTIPGPDGDESKVEELPDGSVLLSCRKYSSNGRRFNVFAYSDKKKATGSWGTAADAVAMDSCTRVNGDIIVVPSRRASDRKKVWLAIQSLPQSKSRDHLGFYYREMPYKSTPATAVTLRDGWKKGRMIRRGSAAYSTMVQLPDGNIGILFEADLNDSGFDNLFANLKIEDITAGEYSKR